MRRITMGTLDISRDEITRVADTLASGMISAGPVIDEFEDKVAKMHGKKYGVFVNSGQSALEVALVLMRKKLGIYPLLVAVPATTYAATLWAVINTGNIPVLCDIDPDTFCLSYQRAPLHNCNIILPVDLCGHAATPPQDISIPIIEDACEAVGNPAANYGDIICMSFYVSHIITTGSGGMVCLDDLDLVDYARSYISHGRKYGGDFTATLDSKKWVDKFEFDKVGVSYRGNCMEAAMGLAQLEKINNIVHTRKRNAAYLRKLFSDSELCRDNIQWPDSKYIADCVFQFFPLLLGENVDRTKVLEYLFEKGIDSRVLFPLTNQLPVKRCVGDRENDFPVSHRVNESGFIVGCHQHLTLDDMKYTFETIRDALFEVGLK